MSAAAEAMLGYRFKQPALLDEALTHRSVSGPGHVGYDRLEFLGDRVLALVVTDLLFKTFPVEDEGALAKRLVALVRQETLAQVARTIDLGPHVRLSKGESEGGGQENDAILSDVIEALIAAIYLDGGLEAAFAFVERHWRPLLEGVVEPPKDAKTALQEWAQGRGLALPAYDVVSRTGPDHAPQFEVQVSVAGQQPQKARGKSKRMAEQEAAALMLQAVQADV